MKAKKAKPATATAAKGSPTSTTADLPMSAGGTVSPMMAVAPVAVDDAVMTLEQREDHLRMLKMMAAGPK